VPDLYRRASLVGGKTGFLSRIWLQRWRSHLPDPIFRKLMVPGGRFPATVPEFFAAVRWPQDPSISNPNQLVAGR